jgi:serine/threonine protein kinase
VLVKEIGSGAASRVYQAICRKSGCDVAIKVYKKAVLSALNIRQVLPTRSAYQLHCSSTMGAGWCQLPHCWCQLPRCVVSPADLCAVPRAALPATQPSVMHLHPLDHPLPVSLLP